MQGLSLYAGVQHLGYLLPRRQGIEAFNIDTQSLGVFPDMKSAADAVSAQAVSR
jgi:hypothetical protein